MSKIRSVTLPDSNCIPQDGGTFEIDSDLIKVDYNDSFSTSPDSNLWSKGSDQNVTEGHDGHYFVQYDTTSTTNTSKLIWQSSNTVKAKNLDIEMGYQVQGVESGGDWGTDGNTKIFKILLSADIGSYVGIAVVKNLGNVKLIIEKSDLNGTYSNYVDLSDFKNSTLRLSVREGKVVAFEKNSTGFKKLDETPFDDENKDYQLQWGSEIAGDSSLSGKTLFTGVRFLPYVSADFLQVDQTFCTKVEDGRGRFKSIPYYPSKGDITLYGSGGQNGQSETLELKVIQESLKEDSTKFLISPVEKFYSDYNPELVCRLFGVEDEDNRGNLIVNQKCFCDGTAEDGETVDVQLVNRAELNIDKDRTKNPEFLFEDSNGDKYGPSFDLSRQYIPETLSKVTNQIKELRSLVLSDNDRFYYGVQHSSLEGLQTIGIDYTAHDTSLGGSAWEILDRQDQDAVLYSGDHATPPNASYDLSEGRYIFKVRDAEVGIYWGTVAGGNLIEEYNANENTDIWPNFETGDFEIHFDVKQYQGQLVYFVHDICNNNFDVYEDITFNISLLTDSFSAFENDEGDIVFVYQKMPDLSVKTNRSNSLYYRVIDKDTGAVGSEYEITFPPSAFLATSFGVDNPYWGNADQYLMWSFDVERFEDDVKIVCNYSTEIHRIVADEIFGETRQYTNIQRPYLDNEVTTISISLQDFDFTSGDLNLGYVDYERNKLSPRSLKGIVEATTPDFGFTEDDYGKDHGYGDLYPVSKAFVGLDRVRLNYDKDQGQMLLSGLTHKHRLPFIWSGNGRVWSEITMPYHFSVYQYIYHCVQNGQALPAVPDTSWAASGFGKYLPVHNYHALESLSACFGPDGFIYSICTKLPNSSDPFNGDNFATYDSELGVIDPEILDSSENYFYRLGTGRVFEPEFRFQSIPVLNSYGASQTKGTFRSLNISRQFQYLLVTAGCDNSQYPIIFQSQNIEQIPFLTPCEDTWVPEFGDFGGVETEDTVTKGDVYWTVGSKAATQPTIKRELTQTTTPFGQAGNSPSNRRLKNNLGYKFHCRLKAEPDGSSYSEKLIMEAVGVKAEPDGTNKKIAKARFYHDGGSVLPQIYDYINTQWVNIGWSSEDNTWLSTNDISDYYIFLQQHVDNKFRALFVVKDKNSTTQAISGAFQMDFKSSGDFATDEELVEDGSTEETGFNIYFDNTSSDNLDEARVYQLGWNIISAKDYPSLIGDQGTDTVELAHFFSGKTWRQVDDGILFHHRNGEPDVNFQTSLSRRDRKSFDTHWPNGFYFGFSNTSGYLNDSWELGRDSLPTNLNSVRSDKMHGITFIDTNSYIWADAHDSDLDKFSVESFLIDGANFRYVELYGKDTIGGSWTQIETLDLLKYTIPADSYTVSIDTDTKTGRIKIETGDFNIGSLNDGDYYIEQGGDPSTKIISASGEEILFKYTDVPRYSTSSDLYIISSKGVKILPSVEKYRYIGMKISFSSVTLYETGQKGTFRSFDFGLISEIPLEYNYSEGGPEVEMESEVGFVYDEQPFSTEKTGIKKNFNFEYSILNSINYARFESLVEKITLNRKPIWVIENYKAFKDKIYLSLTDGTIDKDILIDEDGDKIYTLSINFRSVR